MTIITSFGIFDPTKIPAKSSEAFTHYGEDQLEVLIQHFGEAYLDGTALEQEWVYTKQLLSDSFSSLSTREVFDMILKDNSLTTLLPQICKLAAIALTIPVTTADCERGFSAVKRIKTSLRNRLKTETLDYLLRISTEGPDPDSFDCDQAVTLWGSQRNRRLKL